MKEESGSTYEYTTYPLRFVTYKWYKPLLVGLLGFLFMLLFQIVELVVAVAWAGDVNFLYSLSTNYDDMNPYTAPGALVLIGGVAALLPALAVAALIVRDRPFSSYSSSRGGWNWSAFFKCIAVAIVVLAAFTLVQIALFPGLGGAGGEMRFTIAGFIVCTLLVPVQCMGEEYVFRGFFMQTVGAWTKLPILAVVVQAALFAALHPYNVMGVVAIFLSGIVSGVVAWQARGLEATSALHVVNNLLAFYLGGFGLQATTSEVDIVALVFTVLVDVVYAAVVLYVGRKRAWFYSKGDGVAAFNEKRLAKLSQHNWT